MFPEAKPSEGNIEVETVFCYTSHGLKTRKNWEEIVYFTPAGSQIYSSFKEHDLITCESKVHVVVSLSFPGELVSFDPRDT